LNALLDELFRLGTLILVLLQPLHT